MNPSAVIRLKVKFTPSSYNEIKVEVNVTDSVGALKSLISKAISLPDHKYVRIIHNGKLLAPDQAELSAFKLEEAACIHSVIASKALAPAERMAFNEGDEEAGLGQLRGLDALRRPAGSSSALTLEQVLALRAYFQDSIDEHAEQALSRQGGESEQEFRLRAEEDWMQAQDEASDFRMNLSTIRIFSPRRIGDATSELSQTSFIATIDNSAELGSHRDLFFGFVLGYVLGFMMIFCVWDRNVSYRQKIGILAGIICQLVGNIWARNGLSYRSSDSSISSTTTSNTIAIKTSKENRALV